MRNIPRVDLSEFVNGDAKQKQAFVEKLGKAYEDVGFVSVVNHGISDETIEVLYDQVKTFFSLPKTAKKKCEIEGLAGQRGYTSFGKEHAKGSDAPDLKEFYQWGQTVQGEELAKDHYPDNVMVQDLPAFNEVIQKAYRSFEESGKYLLQAIAIYLGLDEDYFDQKIHNGNSILRAIHYPPITEEPKDAIRAEQHEDINLITLLVGASADGLELLNKENVWLPINAGPGEIV
ncbi:MAG: isopenicillin N synthase family dioxygenase, partial [Chitinophagales bacterium]